MQIRRIFLRNLHSIRSEVEIDFMASPLSDSGLFAITGDTGAGKTTILDAITLAMYGSVCRNSKPEEVLSHGAEEGFAECDFEANERLIRCQWRCWQPRSKKGAGPKTERSVSEWNEEKKEYLIVAERKIREVDAFIEAVSGLDFERFTRSAMLAQGDFAAFLKALPKERSELLERITGTEVYSELGKAAHERHNLERQTLNELTAKREALQVFGKEELAERKTLLKELDNVAKQKNTDLNTTKSALQWLQQVGKLRQQQAASAQALAEMEVEKTALQADVERLELHRKTLPLHPTLARLDDKLAEVVLLESAITNLTQRQAGEAQAVELAKVVFDEKTVALESLKASQPTSMRLFDEVGQMDGRLHSLSENLAKADQEVEAAAGRINEIEAQLKVQTASINSHQLSLADLDNWLTTNAVWASLPQDLPAVTIHRESLRDNIRTQNRLKEEVKSFTELVEKAKREISTLEANLSREKTALTGLLDLFEETAPDAFAPNRQDLLEKMGREIEALGEQHKNFSKLNALNAEYRTAINALNAQENQLALLRQEELWLDKSLLSAYEEAEEWEQVLDYRRAVYNQQALLANYAKDRDNLQEGDPCPLCMSVHHPFRVHEVKPFVDEAKKDLQAAENVQRERQQQCNTLLKKHIEINTKIQQIETPGTGSIAVQEARIEDLEQRLAALLPGLDQEDFSRSYGAWFTQKIENFESELAGKKAVRERLSQLNGQIAGLEEAVRRLEMLLKDCRFAEQQNESSRTDRAALLMDLTTKFGEATAELDKLVGKYGYRFSMDGANQMFSELERQAEVFNTKKTSRDGHLRQLDLLFQSKNIAGKTLDEYSERQKILVFQAVELKAAYDELTAIRTARFGEKNPGEEREKLLQTIEAHEQSHADARSVFEAAKKGLALTQQQLESHLAQNKAGRKNIEELEASLQKGLKKSGFQSLEALRAAILPTQEAEQIEMFAEQIKLKEATTRQAAKMANEALNAALSVPLTEEPEQILGEKLSLLETELQAVQQQIGALNQQLKDNDARKTEGEALLQTIGNQRIVYNRWAAVHDLIGSHDGAKFRKFAQGLTLLKLVQLANLHLANLYGRYVVMKRPGEDLELDIVDTYQADNMRSMMTLSGGESFLVSLSLALGLSDLAGRNANIRSLFIDEGFGTLDEDTLDMAISTLENLQSKGKTIGIISHVKELKERIPTQVRVLKKGGGTSVVEVV